MDPLQEMLMWVDQAVYARAYRGPEPVNALLGEVDALAAIQELLQSIALRRVMLLTDGFAARGSLAMSRRESLR